MGHYIDDDRLHLKGVISSLLFSFIPLLLLPNFDKAINIEFYDLGVSIGGVFM